MPFYIGSTLQMWNSGDLCRSPIIPLYPQPLKGSPPHYYVLDEAHLTVVLFPQTPKGLNIGNPKALQNPNDPEGVE